MHKSTDMYIEMPFLAGDFWQLPPVANELVGDRGLHCFNVPWFNRIKLNFIHRQSDTTLIKCINALEKGNVSDEDVAFINSLSRSLENEENCVYLFSRNIDVDLHNYTKIQTIAGELKIHVYKSVDEGNILKTLIYKGPSRPWSYGRDPMQAVPITTDVVISNLDQGGVYNIMW